MSSSTKAPAPSPASDKLQSILYQYIQLYESWSEDQQAFVTQAEKLEAVLNRLSSAAKTMGEFKPQVIGQAVEASLQGALHRAVQAAVNAAGDLTDRTGRLNTTLSQTESILERYAAMWSDWRHWITIGLTAVVSGVVVGLLAVRLTISTVSVSLAAPDADALQRGKTFALVWPLLSPAERKHYEQLAKKVDAQKS